jgi:hypothetical protein
MWPSTTEGHWRSAGNGEIYCLADDIKIREVARAAAHTIERTMKGDKKVRNGKFSWKNKNKMEGRRPEECITGPANRRMGNTSWGKRRMEAPGPRRGCAIAAHIYQCQRKQVASPACQASLSATDRSFCHLAAPLEQHCLLSGVLTPLLVVGRYWVHAILRQDDSSVWLTSENDCKPTKRI